MLAWKAAHSGNRPSDGKPKLPAGPKGVPEDAVREMLEAKGPFLLDCHTFYHDHVLPMIPPGKTYKDILTE